MLLKLLKKATLNVEIFAKTSLLPVKHANYRKNLPSFYELSHKMFISLKL